MRRRGIGQDQSRRSLQIRGQSCCIRFPPGRACRDRGPFGHRRRRHRIQDRTVGWNGQQAFSAGYNGLHPVSGLDPNYCEFFFGNDLAPGGYVWIFPKGRGLANVGIGLQGSRSRPSLPLRLLESFLERRMPEARIHDPTVAITWPGWKWGR